MKERPILFSGPMVRAILEGRKTQTRRVADLPESPLFVGLGHPSVEVDGTEEPGPERFAAWGEEWNVRCPYGQPRDRLWVRETWRTVQTAEVQTLYFRADEEWHDFAGWRPSIYMPRWACRLELELTQVRVERLQDISEEDAKAEGCTDWKVEHWSAYDPKTDAYPEFFVKPGRTDLENLRRHPDTEVKATERFRVLWEDINAKRGYGWEANPWVWALTFKRAEAKERAA